MKRDVALAIALAAFGLFVLQLLFRAEAWHLAWLPHFVRAAVENGTGEVLALAVALIAGFFWLRQRS